MVAPLILGSYENEKLLKLLKEAKFAMTLEDHSGKTPADYASLQHTQKLFKAFYKLKILVADDGASVVPAGSHLQEDQKMEDEDETQIVDKKEEDQEAAAPAKAEQEGDRMKSLAL